MSQFYVRVSKANKTTGEHASDNMKKAREIFDALKDTAPQGSKLELRDFSLPDSLVFEHTVTKKNF